jgi:hypothetical protein
MGSLVQSMGLALEEFYQNLPTVGVSSHTGAGIDDLLAAIDVAVGSYYKDFLPMIRQLQQEKAEREQARLEESRKRLEADMAAGGRTVLDPASPSSEQAKTTIIPLSFVF